MNQLIANKICYERREENSKKSFINYIKQIFFLFFLREEEEACDEISTEYMFRST